MSDRQSTNFFLRGAMVALLPFVWPLAAALDTRSARSEALVLAAAEQIVDVHISQLLGACHACKVYRGAAAMCASSESAAPIAALHALDESLMWSHASTDPPSPCAQRLTAHQFRSFDT